LLDQIGLAANRSDRAAPRPFRARRTFPNVVYTRGAMRHRDKIIRYAVSDTFCSFATIDIASLIAAMDRSSSLHY
jgi:hypothetical protein